jgi:molecular chaperone DnaK (HSP70)
MSARGGGWTLCIDFGTAFSKAAAAPVDVWSRFDPAWVRPLMLADEAAQGNPFLLESAVFVDDDKVVFGADALARADAGAGEGRLALRSFKTLLSVSDLERALNTVAPTSIDPHRAFTMRDLVVLYLAYLLAAIERARGLDPVLAKTEFSERRYAAPAWRSGDSAGHHNAIVALFAEAEATAAQLGERLLDPEGLSVVDIEASLAAARLSPSPHELGLIFEATAAAAYSAIGLEHSAPHLVVVDIGAGTTDMAAIFRSGARVTELAPARVTLKHGGDYLDRVIANLVTGAAAVGRLPERKAMLWSLVMRQMPDIKESVLHDGRALLRYGQQTLTLKHSDLERDRDFRLLAAELAHAFDHSLAVACRHARSQRRSEINVIAVGGGAGAPVVQEILKRPPRDARRFRIIPRPATPEWAYTDEFGGNLAPVFPQLAIAIGGAIAPPEMLAAT